MKGRPRKNFEGAPCLKCGVKRVGDLFLKNRGECRPCKAKYMEQWRLNQARTAWLRGFRKEVHRDGKPNVPDVVVAERIANAALIKAALHGGDITLYDFS